jgi:hypothetical protein
MRLRSHALFRAAGSNKVAVSISDCLPIAYPPVHIYFGMRVAARMACTPSPMTKVENISRSCSEA